MRKGIVIHNKLSASPSADESDVLDQVMLFERALADLEYPSLRLAADLDLKELKAQLNALNPMFVVNLVEGLDGDARFIHWVPQLLEELQIPFTGCSSWSIAVTGDKVLAKVLMKNGGIPTPEWIAPDKIHEVQQGNQYLAKPVWEDASVGISDENLLSGNPEAFESFLNDKDRIASHWFFEQFIEGREFNIALLGRNGEPEVLPMAELCFDHYPDGKPRIVGYAAKWDESSFEFKHTRRVFGTLDQDAELQRSLYQVAVDCWQTMALRGYARVDVRVDHHGTPWVLEVNANPCLSPDAGFMAAAAQAGYSESQVVERIINESVKIR